jgi:hypothetical protein
MIGPHMWNDNVACPGNANCFHFTFWYEDWCGAEPLMPMGRTNYAGVGGAGKGTSTVSSAAPLLPAYKTFEGIYTNRSTWSLGQVSALDGTSNTLMYGETSGRFRPNPDPLGCMLGSVNCNDTVQLCGGPKKGLRNAFDKNWFGVGSLSTVYGLGQGQDADYRSFSSNHSGVVQFCFADGAVRTVRIGSTANGPGCPGAPVYPPSSDWFILMQLAGVRDGVPVDASALSN